MGAFVEFDVQAFLRVTEASRGIVLMKFNSTIFKIETQNKLRS